MRGTKVYLVGHTDIWQSHNSLTVIGIASSPEEGVEMAKRNDDAVSDVKTNDGHVVIDEYNIDFDDSEYRVFCTDSDDDWEKITGEERYKDED